MNNQKILYMIYAPENLPTIVKIADRMRTKVEYDHDMVLVPSRNGINHKKFVFCDASPIYIRDIHATLCNITEITGLTYNHDTGEAVYPSKSVFLVEYDPAIKKPYRSIWIGGSTEEELEDIHTFVPRAKRELERALALEKEHLENDF